MYAKKCEQVMYLAKFLRSGIFNSMIKFLYLQVAYEALWLRHVLNINSWPHRMKGGKEVQALGIKEGGERVADVTRILT